MKNLYCPVCDKVTPTKLWNLLPGVGFCRRVFWCSGCHEWFDFSSRARRSAILASLISVVLAIVTVRIYLELVGPIHHRWAAIALWAGLLGLHNAASAWTLARKAQLEGPIDHSP